MGPTTVFAYLWGTVPLGLIFEDFVYFLKKIKQLWIKYPMDLVRNVPRNSKILVFTSVETIVVKLQLVICHKLVLKSVSYLKIVKNTPILIEQSIACNELYT